MSRWTDKPPTKPGWYWALIEGEAGCVRVEERLAVGKNGVNYGKALCLLVPTIGEWMPVLAATGAKWSEHPIRQPGEPEDNTRLMKVAMNIVSQIMDEAGTDVSIRQRINDECDQFVMKLIDEAIAGSHEDRGAIMEQFHKLWGQAHDRTYEKKDWIVLHELLNRIFNR